LLDSLMNIAIKYRERADASLMLPQVNWREPRNDRRLQMSKTARNSLGASRLQNSVETVEKVKKPSYR
jgi:hypothetical protein